MKGNLIIKMRGDYRQREKRYRKLKGEKRKKDKLLKVEPGGVLHGYLLAVIFAVLFSRVSSGGVLRGELHGSQLGAWRGVGIAVGSK